MSKLKPVLILLATIALLPVGGCATQPGQPGYAPAGSIGMNNTTGGTLIGAGTGALVGSQFGHGSGNVATTVIGGVLGAVAGNQIGQSLDQRNNSGGGGNSQNQWLQGLTQRDSELANHISQRALESGPSEQPVQWRNPDSGHYGTFTPHPAEKQADGSSCRQYDQTFYASGKTEQGWGKACRQADGTWKVMS